MGIERDAVFSPDGEALAFTGEHDGNIDVYTMLSAGGVPKRITYHPELMEYVCLENEKDVSHLVGK